MSMYIYSDLIDLGRRKIHPCLPRLKTILPVGTASKLARIDKLSFKSSQHPVCPKYRNKNYLAFEFTVRIPC